MESFKGVDDTTKQDWIEREILVENAEYDKEAKQFNVEWKLIEAEKISLKELNSLFKSGGYNFNQPGSTDPGFDDLDDYSEY